MVRAQAAALLLVWTVAVTGCATERLSREDVPSVVQGAFAAADVRVDQVAVGPGLVGGRWPVTARVAAQPLTLSVDPVDGRVTDIALSAGDAVSPVQLRRIAGYASNPAAERATRRHRLLIVIVATAALVLGFGVARRLRLREEAQHADEA